MQYLKTKIGSTKRQLNNMTEVLDELYQDVMAVKDKIQTQTDKITEQIMRRMVYLNRLRNKPLMEVNARLDELSRLLDWIEEVE